MRASSVVNRQTSLDYKNHSKYKRQKQAGFIERKRCVQNTSIDIKIKQKLNCQPLCEGLVSDQRIRVGMQFIKKRLGDNAVEQYKNLIENVMREQKLSAIMKDLSQNQRRKQYEAKMAYLNKKIKQIINDVNSQTIKIGQNQFYSNQNVLSQKRQNENNSNTCIFQIYRCCQHYKKLKDTVKRQQIDLNLMKHQIIKQISAKNAIVINLIQQIQHLALVSGLKIQKKGWNQILKELEGVFQTHKKSQERNNQFLSKIFDYQNQIRKLRSQNVQCKEEFQILVEQKMNLERENFKLKNQIIVENQKYFDKNEELKSKIQNLKVDFYQLKICKKHIIKDITIKSTQLKAQLFQKIDDLAINVVTKMRLYQQSNKQFKQLSDKNEEQIKLCEKQRIQFIKSNIENKQKLQIFQNSFTTKMQNMQNHFKNYEQLQRIKLEELKSNLQRKYVKNKSKNRLINNQFSIKYIPQKQKTYIDNGNQTNQIIFINQVASQYQYILTQQNTQTQSLSMIDTFIQTQNKCNLFIQNILNHCQIKKQREFINKQIQTNNNKNNFLSKSIQFCYFKPKYHKKLKIQSVYLFMLDNYAKRDYGLKMFSKIANFEYVPVKRQLKFSNQINQTIPLSGKPKILATLNVLSFSQKPALRIDGKCQTSNKKELCLFRMANISLSSQIFKDDNQTQTNIHDNFIQKAQTQTQTNEIENTQPLFILLKLLENVHENHCFKKEQIFDKLASQKLDEKQKNMILIYLQKYVTTQWRKDKNNIVNQQYLPKILKRQSQQSNPQESLKIINRQIKSQQFCLKNQQLQNFDNLVLDQYLYHNTNEGENCLLVSQISVLRWQIQQYKKQIEVLMKQQNKNEKQQEIFKFQL